jgi:phage recombination protein Bet
VNGSAVMAAPTSAVDPVVAEAITMRERLMPLKNALGIEDLSQQEMDLFAMVALRMRLDPFQKQVYAIKRKGKVTFQVGIDGFRSSAEETGEYRGSDEPEYGPWLEKPYPHPEWARVVVHRETSTGAWIHQSATAYWDEFVADSGTSGNGDLQWRRMPRVMLAKCAEAAAFRKAFPKRFAQVYESAEMQQADAAEQATPVTAPTQRDRIAAQRAALEASATTSAPASGGTGAAQGAPAAQPAYEAPAAESAPAPLSSGPGADDADVIEGEAVEVQAEPAQCASMSPYDPPTRCGREAGHSGNHKNRDRETWA